MSGNASDNDGSVDDGSGNENDNIINDKLWY